MIILLNYIEFHFFHNIFSPKFIYLFFCLPAFYEEEKLKGISGTLSPTINKGICSICQRTSNVSLFLSTTKTGSDGTYTKKGNYICHDSDQCNQQLVQLAPFYEFTERVKRER